MSWFNILTKSVSTGNVAIEKEFELLGNCYGFYGMKSGVGTSTFIMELGVLASEKGLSTCIVDCNPLSNFYLDKCSRLKSANDDLIGVEVPSINRRFIKRSCRVSDCLININPNLNLLGFGETQTSEIMSMDISILQDTYKELKDIFDLVLMDIPHMPWCETVPTALECCNTVYNIWGFSLDMLMTESKARNFYNVGGLEQNLNNILIFGAPLDGSIKASINKVLSPERVIFEAPYVASIKKLAVSNLSVLAKIHGSGSKQYASCLDYIFDEITNGLEDKNILEEKGLSEDINEQVEEDKETK